MDLTRRIAACGILLEFIRFPIAPFSGSRVEVIGTLSREDLGEIRRVVGRAEIAMEQPQFPPELPRLSWKRVRVLPTYVRIRMANRIVSIKKESDNSVRVVSISGLWGRRPLRVEMRDGHWVYVGLIHPNPHIIAL